jgi:hypothetical protein
MDLSRHRDFDELTALTNLVVLRSARLRAYFILLVNSSQSTAEKLVLLHQARLCEPCAANDQTFES